MMMTYSEEDRALMCTGNSARQHKPTPLHPGKVTSKDGSVEEFLSCPKCHRVHPFPESLKASLERMNQVLEVQEKQQAQPPVDPSKVAENVANTLIIQQKGGSSDEDSAGNPSDIVQHVREATRTEST